MKQFIKNKEKRCVICKGLINEEHDKWVKLVDYNKGREGATIYYHLECWRERFKITNSARKKEMYGQVAKVINNIKDKFGNGGMVIAQ